MASTEKQLDEARAEASRTQKDVTAAESRAQEASDEVKREREARATAERAAQTARQEAQVEVASLEAEAAGRESMLRDEIDRLQDALEATLRTQGRLEETMRERQERLDSLQNALRQVQREQASVDRTPDAPLETSSEKLAPTVGENPPAPETKSRAEKLRDTVGRYLREADDL